MLNRMLPNHICYLADQKCHPVDHEECGVEYEEVCAEAVEARCQVSISKI